ncbi:MAG: shikimate dehydrogenase family protein [Geminicoccaceae bacterium]
MPPTYSPYTRSTIIFLGVSTVGSSIMRIFPLWARTLGLDAELVGVDMAPSRPPGEYRNLVSRIASDAHVKGALITTHKVDLFEAAGDLIDEFDEDARRLGEVSCLAKRDGKLYGFAKDAVSAGRAIDDFVQPTDWKTKIKDVLCLGAGGASIAITAYLARMAEGRGGPERIRVTDIDPKRLANLRSIHKRLPTNPVTIEYLLTDEGEPADAWLANCREGALIINATGMGKDRPGSPLSDQARFPQGARVWELNYRGELSFLRQAERQAHKQELHISVGWVYFLHGRTLVIAEVFDVEILSNGPVFGELAALAANEMGRS